MRSGFLVLGKHGLVLLDIFDHVVVRKQLVVEANQGVCVVLVLDLRFFRVDLHGGEFFLLCLGVSERRL